MPGHVPVIFFFNDTATTEIYTLSLHDALPISVPCTPNRSLARSSLYAVTASSIHTWCRRSEEHTSELQSRRDLVCRLLLEKKKNSSGTEIGSLRHRYTSKRPPSHASHRYPSSQ